MKALTLWQPWATCIVHGPKRVENRPWSPTPSAVGTRIAIHAGKKWDEDGAQFCAERGFEIARADCMFGAVLGTAVIDRVIRALDFELPVDQHGWFFGPVGWILRDVRPCTPVPASGALSLWALPEAVVRLVVRSTEGVIT